MRSTAHRRLAAVQALPPAQLALRFADGLAISVDLSALIARDPALAPLRDPAHAGLLPQRQAAPAAHGRTGLPGMGSAAEGGGVKPSRAACRYVHLFTERDSFVVFLFRLNDQNRPFNRNITTLRPRHLVCCCSRGSCRRIESGELPSLPAPNHPA